MDRIRQALDRAREEGTLPGETYGDGEAATSRPRRESATADRASSDALGERSVSYDQTRSFEPDPAVLARNRVLTGEGADPATSAYKVLRTRVIQGLAANDWNTIAVTSPGRDQGKSLTAVNLAVSLAREVSRTVLLVDLDLRRPSVHRLFGFEPEKGVSDHLLRDTPLEEILVHPNIDGLVLLPGRESLRDSSEILASPKMGRLVHELKSRYSSRLVVFDLSPVFSADDALAFAPYVDAALLVVGDGSTTRTELTGAMQFLRATEVIGTVLNRADDPLIPYY